ncbi:cytochrome c3 family protein [Thermodesulfobacteriota bacterium]
MKEIPTAPRCSIPLFFRSCFQLFFVVFLFFTLVDHLQAKVTGQCSNCHTMHNSQNGTNMVHVGTVGNYASWDGGQIDNGVSFDPMPNLLVSDCVGCHSSTSAQTIENIGSSRIPIVFNIGSAPTNPLAGGNFYWMVAEADDTKGHNVHGISDVDDNILESEGAPGQSQIGCSSAINSCHYSLSYAETTEGTPRKGGCQACHETKHHGIDPAAGDPEDANSGWYRFLNMTRHSLPDANRPVYGIEDDDWEQTLTSTDHNIYYGGFDSLGPGVSDPDENPETIGRFCAGCHDDFHASGHFLWAENGMGSPWLRHPADRIIPNSGEYTGVIGATYNTTVPVGKQTLVGYNPGEVENGDKVICMTCHRAHGSPYSDMLRWDYTNMQSHTTGDTDTNGCFFCHREKDDT